MDKRPEKCEDYLLAKKMEPWQKSFLWVKGGKVYHYEALDKNNRKLFFRGVYKEQDLDVFEAFILHRLGYNIT